MSNIGWIFDAALNHIDQDDVHAAVLSLQSIVSRHEVSRPASARCRILTLGRFVIIRGNEVVSISKRSQRVPLELLKVILALGGRSASMQTITDLLWPDADGDAAHAAFKVALHRARRLLGSPTAITCMHGVLALNEKDLWVDAWAFEQWFDALPSMGVAANASSRESAMRALRLYKGEFLGPAAPPIANPWRERLRSKFIRAVLRLGRECEGTGAWAEAVDLYERGIEVDALAEDVYQRLMMCHLQLGQTARAVDVYRRCRTTLDAFLGTSPKMKTQSIYAAVCASRSTAQVEQQRA